MVPVEGGEDWISGLGIQNDLQGVWYHNYIWASLHPGTLYEVYWFYREHILNPPQYDHQYHHHEFVNFLQDISLSNGHYQDLAADVSNPDLRLVGQKDLVNGRAHAWIQNRTHTWKNVIDGVPIPPVSGTISIAGFAPETVCAVRWWNTYTGEIELLEAVKIDQEGVLRLEVENLRDDVAVKIGDSNGGCAAPGL
jgi:hypothetical protein